MSEAPLQAKARLARFNLCCAGRRFNGQPADAASR